jgi:DNA-binding CsgD family transcriptional regulator
MTKRTTKAHQAGTRKTVSTGGKGYRFRPAKEQTERVEMLISAGMSERAIAIALGIDRLTLRKHFGDALLNGRSRRRSEVLEALFRTGVGGNVAAQKAFLRLNTIASVKAGIAAKPMIPHGEC